MAETVPSKRQRDETHFAEDCEDSKRHKSSNQILSILESEEDELNQDFTDIFTTLQQEISSDSTAVDPTTCPTTTSDAVDGQETAGCSPSSDVREDEEEDDKERVIRHLLEASDDELGIPTTGGIDGVFDETDGGDYGVFLCDNGLWEFEDVAANYYALLQSELLM